MAAEAHQTVASVVGMRISSPPGAVASRHREASLGWRTAQMERLSRAAGVAAIGVSPFDCGWKEEAVITEVVLYWNLVGGASMTGCADGVVTVPILSALQCAPAPCLLRYRRTCAE